MDKEYVICNFLNEYLTGYFDSGYPDLSCLHDDCMTLTYKEAQEHLAKLHKMGFTGLQIKEYQKGIYD